MKWHRAIVCAAALLCSCQPRGSEPGAGSNGAGTPAPDGVRISMPAATGLTDGGASNAAGAAEAAPAAASTAGVAQYAPPAAAAPVRMGKIATRFGHTELSATARERRLDAKEATQLINARSDRLIEKYGGQDTSPRAARVERGPVLLDAAQAPPRATEAAETADP